jgi:diguanylate cyclase (GGDEF)-like protein
MNKWWNSVNQVLAQESSRTLEVPKTGVGSDFRRKSSFWIGVAGLFVLTPFSINNFWQGRLGLGLGSMVIIGILICNAWAIPRGRQIPWLTPLAMAPAVICFLVNSIQNQGVIGVLWCYPSILSFYFMMPSGQARLANLALLSVALPVACQALDAQLAARVVATLLAVSVFSAIFLKLITDQQRQLAKLAVIDPLTGVYNRLLLDSTLERACNQAGRGQHPVTLVSVDLDHFKSINDSFGHDAGDSVLKQVGKLFQQRLRRSDQIFRLGGEEFLLLLFNTDSSSAVRLSNELRQTLSGLELLPERRVTASFGVAQLEPDDCWEAWLKRGDLGLYEAKNGGRNRVVPVSSAGIE